MLNLVWFDKNWQQKGKGYAENITLQISPVTNTYILTKTCATPQIVRNAIKDCRASTRTDYIEVSRKNDILDYVTILDKEGWQRKVKNW